MPQVKQEGERGAELLGLARAAAQPGVVVVGGGQQHRPRRVGRPGLGPGVEERPRCVPWPAASKKRRSLRLPGQHARAAVVEQARVRRVDHQEEVGVEGRAGRRCAARVPPG